MADRVIYPVNKEDYPLLLAIWEASVRATHHFLKEEDIAYYKPLILNEYFDAVRLCCLRADSGEVVAFMGTSSDKIEMLFIHPAMRGKGYGKILLLYAIEVLGLSKVDVNEENEQAVDFYKHMGFTVVDRSATDGQGKQYPILFMSL